MKKKMAKIAGISFLIALFLIDSPVWFISVIAVVVMGVATFKGQLWDYKE